ncbi:MAG: hydrogenase nickel incorporation protein HypB [Chloroflexia bacterium]
MMRTIPVIQGVLSANDELAQENRERLDRAGVLTVNLMSAPGAGKTSLILRTAEVLQGQLRLGVVEGDVASQVDAERVAAAGLPVVQINTGGGCHLDANMLRAALASLPLGEIDLLIIENVGNLICPAAFRLGEHLRVVLTSLAEGDDKPQKYPDLFLQADAIVVNKLDLQEFLDFDRQRFRELVRGMNPDAVLFELSCRNGDGVEAWASWLRARREEMRKRRSE